MRSSRTQTTVKRDSWKVEHHGDWPDPFSPRVFPVLLLITLCYSGIPQPQVSAQERLIEAYAASVNDRVILISDVIGRMRSREAPLRKRYAGDELADQLEVLFRDPRAQRAQAHTRESGGEHLIV